MERHGPARFGPLEGASRPAQSEMLPTFKTPSASPGFGATREFARGPLVGTGSFGAVHKCLCLRTGKLVAIKSASATNSQQLQCLEREIACLKQVTSPHVISYVSDCWTLEGHVPTRNLVMELASGCSIAALLKLFASSGLPEAVVRRYTRDLVLGLLDIHAMGLAHLDVKGANALCSDSGIKLCDFGASHFERPGATCQGELRGTLCWMAPEVAKGDGGTVESDIWSLGCTVIEMLTGCPPWASQCQEQGWRAVMARLGCTKELPAIPLGISESAQSFLEACLLRDPRQRPTAEQLLQHPFLAADYEDLLTSSAFDATQTSSPVSTLSPLRSVEASSMASTRVGTQASTSSPSDAHQAQPSPRPSDLELQFQLETVHESKHVESPGSSATSGAGLSCGLFSLCSGPPSPLLLSPLHEVAAALDGTPARGCALQEKGAAPTAPGSVAETHRSFKFCHGALVTDSFAARGSPKADHEEDGNNASEFDEVPIAMPVKDAAQSGSVFLSFPCRKRAWEDPSVHHIHACLGG